MTTKREALLAIYATINGPVKAGPMWVTYGRKQVDAILETMKAVLIEEGFEFRGEAKKMNGMISHAKGDASWHREQRGIKTPEQKRIEELEAENRIERNLRIGVELTFDMLNEEIGRMKAELAECKRDAERYKFLRVVGDEYEHMRIFDSRGHLDPEFLDEAIDAAIAAMGEKK